MSRRWLAPLRLIGRHWLALLLASIFGFFAYHWQTPGPLWQIRLNHRGSLRGFSADGQAIHVSRDFDVIGENFEPHYYSIWTGDETEADKGAKEVPKQPHQLPYPVRGIPSEVSPLEIQSEANVSSKLVLGYVPNRDQAFVELRLYRVYPDSHPSTLIWSHIYRDGGETLINIDQRFANTVALLEFTTNSTELRDLTTGLSQSLQTWHQRFHQRHLNKETLILNFSGNIQIETRLVRLGNVGFAAISADKKYLFCSFEEDAEPWWKVWDWCLLKVKGQPAEWDKLGKRTYAELLEIATQQNVLSLPCLHQGPYQDVPHGCQFAFHPSGNLFALLQENKSYSMLSVWPFPVRRMLRQWIVIATFAIAPIIIAAIISYRRRFVPNPQPASQ